MMFFDALDILEGSGSNLEEIWKTLLDPTALATVIPGCHKLDQVEENNYKAEVSLGVGPVRGRFKANVSLSELIENQRATLSGGLIGPLGASQGNGHVSLNPTEGGTKITYDYAIELSGTVASVGGRLIEGAAKALVNQFFQRLSAQVSGKSISQKTPWWRKFFRSLGLIK